MLSWVTHVVLGVVVGSYLPLLVANIAPLYWPPGQPKAPPPMVTGDDWARAAKKTAKQLGLIWAIIAAITVAVFVATLFGG